MGCLPIYFPTGFQILEVAFRDGHKLQTCGSGNGFWANHELNHEPHEPRWLVYELNRVCEVCDQNN